MNMMIIVLYVTKKYNYMDKKNMETRHIDLQNMEKGINYNEQIKNDISKYYKQDKNFANKLCFYFSYKKIRKENKYIYDEMKSTQYYLQKKVLHFFIEGKKEHIKTNINIIDTTIAFLNYKNIILIQVCKYEINILYYKNTYVLIKKYSY